MSNRLVILAILFLAIAGIAANILSVLTWDLSLTANDGIQYISTAKNWLAGRGFATDALIYGPHYHGVIPALQTVWPNGYPLAIALISLTGLELPHAALVLNLATHAIASLIVYAILRKLEIKREFSIFSAFSFYFLALPWAYTVAAITEPLFTTLLLAVIFFLPNPRHSKLAIWVLCGLLIAAGIYVRYSTVLFAIGVGAGLFLCIVIDERRQFKKLFTQSCKLAVLIAIPVLAFTHLMYRTYSSIGTFDRYAGTKDPLSFVPTIVRWIVKISDLLGFSTSSFFSSTVVHTAFFTFIILVLSIVFVFLLQCFKPNRIDSSKTAKTYAKVFSSVAIAHAIVLVLYLSISSMSSTPLEVITRYIYQIYPGLFILFCYMLFHVLKNAGNRNGKSLTITSGITAGIVVIYFAAQINAVFTTRGHFFTDYKSAADIMLLPVSENRTLVEYTVECFSNTPDIEAIWSTHGQPLHLHTGLPTITHLSIFTDTAFDPAFLQNQIDQYKLGMFYFINFPDNHNQSHIDYMENMKVWLEKSGYKQVSMLSNQLGVDRTVEVFTASPDCGLSTSR